MLGTLGRRPGEWSVSNPQISLVSHQSQSTEERLAQAIKDAGDWFAKHNRGRKLFMTPRFVDNEIQISIRRGDPFSRKSTIDDDGIDTITFREARKDSNGPTA